MLSPSITDRWLAFRRLAHLARPAGRTYGICMQSGEDTAALALYLKEEGASVLLLHEATPVDEAVERAIEADCELLLHGTPERILVLPAPQRRSLEPRLMQLTSGTTGPARVIGRSWQAIEAECEAYNGALARHPSAARLQPVILAPVSHSFGLICGVMSGLRRGLSPLIVDSRNPKRMLAALREQPDHLVYGVPVLFHLLDTLGAGGFRFHTLLNSGAPLPPPLFARLSAASRTLMQQYGCSEMGCITLGTDTEDAYDVGLPLAGHTLTAGAAESGPDEVVVRCRTTGQEVRTGDLGYLGKDGKLRLLARTDDLINVSGRKVLPGVVERVLLELPGIAEAVVYRGRHPVMGERVQALVVPDKELTEETIREWCRGRLPGYQVPAAVRLVEQIPRLPSGKISRRRLTEEESG